jgi:hypothetical protein
MAALFDDRSSWIDEHILTLALGHPWIVAQPAAHTSSKCYGNALRRGLTIDPDGVQRLRFRTITGLCVLPALRAPSTETLHSVRLFVRG